MPVPAYRLKIILADVQSAMALIRHQKASTETSLAFLPDDSMSPGKDVKHTLKTHLETLDQSYALLSEAVEAIQRLIKDVGSP
jgi:hypothetical protein